jgi:riboflavin kinase / FMN adenylyltransferase
MILLVGTFDGVHLGHQSLIRRGKEEGPELTVLTFNTPPAWHFEPLKKKPMIMTLDERIKWLRHYGVDHILTMDFTDEVASLSAYEFLSDLKKQFPHFKLILGHDAKIGKDGSRDKIIDAANKLGIGVEFLPPTLVDGEIVSSTLIRKAIEAEDLAKAQKLLGHNF